MEKVKEKEATAKMVTKSERALHFVFASLTLGLLTGWRQFPAPKKRKKVVHIVLCA